MLQYHLLLLPLLMLPWAGWTQAAFVTPRVGGPRSYGDGRKYRVGYVLSVVVII